MNRLTKMLVVWYCLVSQSRSLEITTSTVKTESSSLTTSLPKSMSTLISSTTPKVEDKKSDVQKAAQLPVELLSEKVLLDPNVVLARIARSAYDGWEQRQGFQSTYTRRPFGISDSYYKERQAYGQQAFGNPNDRRPFGYFNANNNRPYQTKKPNRRSDYLIRKQVTRRPFKIYPVFPG